LEQLHIWRQMMTTLVEKIVGELGDKRRWRQYRARVKALPANYRTTVQALERYLTYFGAITKGDVPVEVGMSDGRWISREREQSLSAIEREFYAEIERGIGKERGRLVNTLKRAGAEDRGSRS
jgi:hypothetical protein